MANWRPHPSLALLPRPIALVLSGGVSLGAMQVGMLRALAEAGLRPDMVVATSVGALNGAYVALGLDTHHVDVLYRVWEGVTQRTLFGYGALLGPLRLAAGSGYMVSNRHIKALIDTWLPELHSELAIPFHAIACRQLTSGVRVLSSGLLRRNVLASASIPIVLPPVDVDGEPLVDGGVVANVPLLQARGLGARTLVVLDSGIPCHPARGPEGVFEYALHLAAVAIRSEIMAMVDLLREQQAVLYLPGICPLEVAPWDFGHTESLHDGAYEAARGFLEATEFGKGPGLYGSPVTVV